MISKRKNMVQLTSAVLTLTLLVLFGASLSRASSNQTYERVIVNLPELPDPFNDEKLSVVLANATVCHTLMGCFEQVPISRSVDDPYHFGTEFIFYAKNAIETAVKFKLVHNCLKNSPDQCNLHPFDLQSLIDAPFHPLRRTIIFVSGYMSKQPTEWQLSAKELWQELEDVNVIIVNWSASNKGIYTKVATNTRPISRQITLLLYYLARVNGLDATDDSFAEKIYMVGHSLGAHICGFVGMDLGGALGRITGLDPAGPNFDELPERFRLDRSDAQLVDALHSNGGAILLTDSPRYGTGLKSGHIDLYANDGSMQPGCANVLDIKGCSHGKSHNYYIEFLQHELSMRDHLKEKYSSLYRLNAYIGDKLDDFGTAKSLVEHCPKAVHINRDLFSTDLSHCSIPIDYFNWYSDVKDELQSSHGIDFRPESRMNNSFFFFTNSETDGQTDHYLMKAHIAGPVQSRASFGPETGYSRPANVLPNECDITFKIKMNSGIDGVYKAEQYKMVRQKDHYDVIAPYLANSLKSKYEIAKLDSQDYNLISDANGSKIISDEEELRKSLLEIFPNTIELSGVYIDEEATEKRREEREKTGIFNSVKRIFNYMRGKKENFNVDRDHTVPCKLAINHLTVRPLRVFHRLMVAYYSVKLNDTGNYPKIILLKDDETELPKHSSLDHGSPSTETPSLKLDTVVIGPFDKSLIRPTENVEHEEVLPIVASIYISDTYSDFTPSTWMILTILLAVFMIALAAISSLKVKRVQEIDKQDLLMNEISIMCCPSDSHHSPN